MRWIRDANRLVKTLAKLEQERDKTNPYELDGKQYYVRALLVSDLIKAVTSRYRSISVSRANRLVEFLLEKKYLEGRPGEKDKDKTFLALTRKGELFIDTAFKIPVGFLKAWYKDDGKIVLAIISSLVLFILTIIGAIATTIVKVVYILET